MSLKDWMKKVEGTQLNEFATTGQIQIKPASQMPKTPGQQTPLGANNGTQPAAKPGQPGQPATNANTQVITQGNKTLGTVNNPQLAQQIKQSIGKGEMSLAGDQLGEDEMMEVAPPGMEKAVLALKKKFPGNPQRAFATAWSMYNKKHGKTEESMMESKQLNEGTLEEIIGNHPHEHKMCQEGWGMDNSLFEALADHYFKEGRIPRSVWHGSAEELREFVESCYTKDTMGSNEDTINSGMLDEEGVAEGSDKTIWVKPSSNHTLIVVKSSSPDIEVGEEYDEGDLNNYANKFGYNIKDEGVAEGSKEDFAMNARQADPRLNKYATDPKRSFLDRAGSAVGGAMKKAGSAVMNKLHPSDDKLRSGPLEETSELEQMLRQSTKESTMYESKKSKKAVEEAVEKTKTGIKHKADAGGYGRKDDEEDTDEDGKKIKKAAKDEPKKGRGRPKKTDNASGEDKKFDFSALSKTSGSKAPKSDKWDKKKTTTHKIATKADREEIDEGQGVAAAKKNPHTSALGKALHRDLSKEKKSSPVQVEKNKARWAQRQADKEQGVAEGLGGDMAKLVGIPAVAGAMAIGAQYYDDQQPHVQVGGQNAKIVRADSNRIPDNAMILTGKDGKQYRVWQQSGKGMNKMTLAAPVKDTNEGVAEGTSDSWRDIAGDKIEQLKKKGVFGNPGTGTGKDQSWNDSMTDIARDKLHKLNPKKEQGVSEGETIEKKGGRVHKGSYGTSHEAGDEGVKKVATQRGRGRPKKDADDSGEVKNYDWSAFGAKKGVKLPAWDKKKTTTHKIATKADREEVDEGKLKGKQSKLDINKNGKVDGGDFAMLRGQKKKDAQMESWDRQLKGLLTEGRQLNEGLTVSTSVGNEGGNDTVSITASDADAHQLLQMLQNAGMGSGVPHHAVQASTAPAQVLPKDTSASPALSGGNSGSATDDNVETPGNNVSSMPMPRGMAFSVQPEETEAPSAPEEFGTLDQEEVVSALGSEQGAADDSGDSALAAIKKLMGQHGASEVTAKEATPPESKAPAAETEVEESGTDGKKPDEDDDGVPDWADKKKGKDDNSDSDEEDESEDDEDDKEKVEEGAQTCNECGGLMEDGHSCGQLNEWSNSPQGQSADEQFETDMKFMQDVISAGLNGRKSTGQATTPVLASQTNRQMSEGYNIDVAAEMRKLAGIR